MHTALSKTTRLQQSAIGLLLLSILGITVFAQFGILVEISTHDINVAIPYLLANGMRLYEEVTSFHPPLISWFMAQLYAINPDVLFNVRLLNILLVVGTGSCVGWTARRVKGNTAGIVSFVFFMLWSINYNTIHFYLDAIIGALAGLIALIATFRQTRLTLILIGICGGVAGLLKQSGLGVLVAPVVWLILFGFSEGHRLRRLLSAGWVLGTALIVYGSQYLIYLANGVAGEASFFLFNPGSANWLGSLTQFFDGVALRSVSLTLIFVPAYLLTWLRDPTQRSIGGLLWLLGGATALLNIPVPGYYHMMALLPIIAIMTGFAVHALLGEQPQSKDDLSSNLRDRLKTLPSSTLITSGMILGVIFAMLITALTPMFIVFSGRVDVLGWDELQPISAWLRENTLPEERILVLPAYDTNGNVYPQAQRLPPYYMKTWFYHARFPANADRLSAAVIAKPPEVIVWFVDFYASVEQYFPTLTAFMDTNYSQVAQLEDLPLQGDVVFLRYIGQ